MTLMQRISVVVATGFGLGYSPVASGTVGTLPGVLWVWWFFPQFSLLQQVVAAAILAVLAIPFCDAAEKTFEKKDDGRIVADEYMTFPICVIGLPVTIPWVLAMAFLTSRFFDILKPPPARGLQRIHGGFGIVIDDVFASIYSLLTNHLLYYAITRWLVS
jgi:phosphatidylglycerophosphatase A